MANSRSVPPTGAQKRLAAERAAAARERIQSAHRRRRLWIIASSVGLVVVIIVAFVVVKAATGSDLKSGKKTTVAQGSVTSTLASIPSSVFDTVGIGTADAAPEPVTAAALGSTTPEIFFVGAEWCPYCAAERWPLTVALSRFGTFTGLGETSSSPTDVNPNTPTLSYEGATYTSKYLTFVGKELYSNQVKNGQYATLDTLDSAQNAVYQKYGKGFPFIDIDGKYTMNSAQYDGKVLAGLTQAEVAKAIDQPSSAISKGVIGAANVLTARICQVTDEQPSSVCTSKGVEVAAVVLAKAASGQ